VRPQILAHPPGRLPGLPQRAEQPRLELLNFETRCNHVKFCCDSVVSKFGLDRSCGCFKAVRAGRQCLAVPGSGQIWIAEWVRRWTRRRDLPITTRWLERC
jgi:hypothetical protein